VIFQAVMPAGMDPTSMYLGGPAPSEREALWIQWFGFAILAMCCASQTATPNFLPIIPHSLAFRAGPCACVHFCPVGCFPLMV
jgi:hypothetical protein